jgi:signal transduction histidine kinase
MGKSTPDSLPEKPLDDLKVATTVPVERSVSDDRLLEERSTTDQSLRAERSITDELLDPQRVEQRVAEAVRESRSGTEKVLRDVRTESDEQLQKQKDGLPNVSEQLEQVAESLSKAAAIPEESGALAPHLSEIADGVAEIKSTLAQERRDADESLREERAVTDRVIIQDLNQVKTDLREELRSESRALRQDRRATDEDLANERRNTDEAVRNVQGLLAQERQEHGHTARGAATRNEFLGIVSHDLRGPLMTIASVAALMDKYAANDENGERTRAWAERVRRSVSVMDRLISDLLDFNSFEDGQLRVTAERLDMRSLIDTAIDSFHGVAEAKGLSLEADLPAEPIMTKHDPHRMLQVVSNLIHNAIKFTGEGGSIRIGVARADNFCQVSVADTGVGIPNSELTGIFERFRQLDPSDHTGLGLGLYISQWIVEAHGGRIWAESKVGVGTTLHFTLPEDRQSS